ncbi:MAG: secretion system protein [Chloroflexi bacterium]|nr:secretion system protein [Chloroflexota bacterium]
MSPDQIIAIVTTLFSSALSVGLCCVLPIGLVAGGVFLISRRSRGDDLDDRLSSISLESDWAPGPSDGSDEDGGQSLREQILETLDNRISDEGAGGRVRASLRKANLKLTVIEYYMLHIVLGVGLGFVGLVAFGPIQGGILFLLGLVVPRIYVSIRQNQRLNKFNDQLSDILNLWVNALRAGFSVPQAMDAVAREAPSPAGEEFKRVVAEMSIGVPMETALNNMLSRIESEDLDLVFTAVNIQREVGGNLAEILETISHTIRERVKIKGEIRVLTSQGRITGMVIGLIPVLLSIFLVFVNPDYMLQLFQGSPVGADLPLPGVSIPCGWPLVGLGLTSMAIGLAIIRRIVDIEV